MKPGHILWLKRLPGLFEIPATDPARVLQRIGFMERHIMLPVRAMVVAMLVYSFDYNPWFGTTSSTLDVVVESVQLIFLFYMAASVILALILMGSRWLPLSVIQWTTVTSCLVDAIFLMNMALLTGGLDSIFFWLFVALIIRTSVSVPPGGSQLIVNLVVCFCYVSVGLLDVVVVNNLDDTTLHALDLSSGDSLGEPFILRLAVLLLTTACCSGVQVLFERQRLAAEEAGEFAAREIQLRSAGRLAAEFAHQIKNPMAVINNAAFSLQRAVRHNKNVNPEQIQIIQEEVERVDKVITQIMGYTQLSEGRVEKLEIIAELERAISQVFPPAVPTAIKIHRDFGKNFPPLLMQRGHLTEIFSNLLQNAREALSDHGNIFIQAINDGNYSVQISVRDDGPGISPERIERIFEAYYTTKEKGTGLGLAIVKHNVELYGGNVRVESKLGHGTKFILIFPAKTLPRPPQS